LCVVLSARTNARNHDLIHKGKRSASYDDGPGHGESRGRAEAGRSEGWREDSRIAAALGDTSVPNILLTRRQVVEEVLVRFWSRKYNANSDKRPRNFRRARAGAKLIALTCGTGAGGARQMSRACSRRKSFELHIVERASDNTIGRVLKKTFSSRI